MTTPSGSVRANLVDITARRVFAAEIGWSAGVIGRIDELVVKLPESRLELPHGQEVGIQ